VGIERGAFVSRYALRIAEAVAGAGMKEANGLAAHTARFEQVQGAQHDASHGFGGLLE
jgi:hypothetical protein